MGQVKRQRRLPEPPEPSHGSIDELSAIFASMVDAVFVYDADGRIVRMNDAAAALTEVGESLASTALPLRARGAIIELRDLDGRVLQREEWPVTRALHGEHLIGAAAPDVRARTPDGRDLILNVSGAPLLDAQGQVRGAICVSRDITERKRLERELAERATELESIFATQAEGVVYADTSGRIVRMNAAQRHLLLARGIDPTEERIDTWAEEMAPHDAHGQPVPRERLPFYRALRGETVSGDEAVELYQHTRDGQDLVVRISGAPVRDAQGRILGAVLTTYDVTHQRRLEEELAARASQIESTLDAMTDGVMLCDVAGRIVRLNAAQRRLLGDDDLHEDAGVDFAKYEARRAPRDHQGHPLPYEQGPMMRVLRGETLTGAQAVEIRLRALNGRDLVVQVSGAPVRDASGRVIGGVVAIRDVTERQRLEQQRSEILRVVAHDLLNPIMGVRLYIYTQQRRLSQGKAPFVPNEELLVALDANLTRIEHLVNDLRTAASIESGALALERCPCDLTALCRREIAAQQALAPSHAIHFEAPEEPIHADVDEQRIGQVITNFLSNALKYSPADHPVTLTLSAEDGAARIAVCDTGPGIPASALDHIWEQFHRVEGIKAQNGSQSLGLGLYICRAIVERHGGQVGVESMVGEGSTFWCRLPMAAPQASAQREA